jgi:hypothetical protein
MSTADAADETDETKNVSNANQDEDEDDVLTDTSCLEVPMMEYYKIRHQVMITFDIIKILDPYTFYPSSKRH